MLRLPASLHQRLVRTPRNHPPNAPSCEWGRRKMNAERAAEYNRRKFGWKKREAKAEEQNE